MILSIPANDHARLYVFDLSGPVPPVPSALAILLGHEGLDLDFVDIVPMADIAEKGLEWYLRSGYEVEPNATELIALSTIGSHMLIVMSRAFGGDPAEIALPDGIRHVTTLTLEGAAPDMTSLHSASAEGILPPADAPAPKGRASSSRVWLYALIIIFAFFGLFAWRIATGSV